MKQGRIAAIVATLALAGSISGASGIGAGVADAAPRKRKAAGPKRIQKATAQTTKAIGDLLGKLKFGMSTEEVKTFVGARIRADYAQKMKEAKDPLIQDRLRAEVEADIAEAAKKYYNFDGKKSGWEVSVLDQEFAQNSGESMFEGPSETKQKRYYFFQNGKLWKMFVAFKSDAFKGLSFEQFAERIQERYGAANAIRKKEKYSQKDFLAYLEWPVSGVNQLRAIDRSELYDIFCLVLSDKAVEDHIKEVRKENAPAGRPTRDGLVEGIMRSGSDSDANENIIDKITGRSSEGNAPELPSMSSENVKPGGGDAVPAKAGKGSKAPKAGKTKAAPKGDPKKVDTDQLPTDL